ncbi:MAG: hypothetical protein EOO20_00335 [Chryseobacterium sp.]|nr:MAG: hypothetical protein EOO20_00335 [Chryseobacterium sp.]
MIVKILAPSATFKAVRYNTDKVDKDKGELLKVANFGALQGLEQLRPSDYINYLEARSATSSRIKLPQFHAVISCKGRSHSKEELALIAEQWLKGMGYGNQPYLLVFHKDTDNNHIHMVSTRIDSKGRKISDSYEKIRAYQTLNQVMGQDEKQHATKAIEKAMEYSFSTRAQLMMLLEVQGYTLKIVHRNYVVSKFGRQQGKIELAMVDERIKSCKKDIDRLAQLRAIIEKYRSSNSPVLKPLETSLLGGKSAGTTGYTSSLTRLMAEKFGVQILYHSSQGKPAYGYTIIDHAKKTIFKGGDIMPLAELIMPSIIENSAPEIHQKNSIIKGSGNVESSNIVVDKAPQQENTATDVDLEPTGARESAGILENENSSWLAEFNLEISDDIDDEAILGRNRQRKRKARTNTR